uniref:Uncharacterized protein n=1 Tax=Grammatophora oceanica TaxID=210454 RepID=A0A7S1YLV5_9STRA|mmetsp:Transcript_5404/g.7540  ORF Transcript_5404/g.7540 Transcript_5404/m.7540 type:complete len:124 (+) Transcript_5404:119-490(+)
MIDSCNLVGSSRNAHTGSSKWEEYHAWTLEMQLLMDRIAFWQKFRKRRDGRQISLKLLRRVAEKTLVPIGSREAASGEIAARKEYYKLKEKNKERRSGKRGLQKKQMNVPMKEMRRKNRFSAI